MAKTIPETSAETTAKATAAASTDSARAHIFERPDGFYWRSPAEGREFGPFRSLADAVRDMQESEAAGPDDMGIEPDETLAEAEDEIGIADWIDPETGEPGEDGSPRLEQH